MLSRGSLPSLVFSRPSKLAFRLVRCAGFKRTVATKHDPKISILGDDSIESYRNAFEIAKPVLFKRGVFKSIPACGRWFNPLAPLDGQNASELNIKYLSEYGHTIVPLEFTGPVANINDKHENDMFERREAPLSYFLEFVRASQELQFEERSHSFRIYLAQCSMSGLGSELQRDLPIPDFVLKAGRGDVYDSSIWIGMPPTFTPLHRDPNPNLFIQLAGIKTVRLFEPAVGQELFHIAQTQLKKNGSANIRGEEMMQGSEKEVLKNLVWEADWGGANESKMYEASLGPGDGLFIPKGWWHSIIGKGSGIVGSANWWFR